MHMHRPTQSQQKSRHRIRQKPLGYKSKIGPQSTFSVSLPSQIGLTSSVVTPLAIRGNGALGQSHFWQSPQCSQGVQAMCSKPWHPAHHIRLLKDLISKGMQPLGHLVYVNLSSHLRIQFWHYTLQLWSNTLSLTPCPVPSHLQGPALCTACHMAAAPHSSHTRILCGAYRECRAAQRILCLQTSHWTSLWPRSAFGQVWNKTSTSAEVRIWLIDFISTHSFMPWQQPHHKERLLLVIARLEKPWLALEGSQKRLICY